MSSLEHISAQLSGVLNVFKNRENGKGYLSALLLVLTAAYYLRRKNWKGKLIVDGYAVGSSDNQTRAKDEFDIIVIGGGTSGCVLASRLSEDPSLRVLLLEAGGSGLALPLVRMPSGSGQLYRSKKHSFGLSTIPQPSATGREILWPRAKMLGGCSSINAQMAQYGSPEDFDEWARHIGDESWAWKNFHKYIQKFEKYTPDPRYPQVDASFRGNAGPARIGYFNTVSKSAQAFIDSCVKVGIPFNPDFNGPNGPLGTSRVLTYVDSNYERVSSESAYLTPDVLGRPNLKVAIHATVTRILFEEVNGETRAVGVEYATSQSGTRYRSRAKKEVILSAGAVHSPHILMVSGVGPAEQLKAHGIPIVKDLPGVGANLVDHCAIDIAYKDIHNDSILNHLQPKTVWGTLKLIKTVLQYKLGYGGLLASNFGEAAAFVRSDDPKLFPEAEYPQKLLDTTSSKNSPDLELFVTPFAYKEHGASFFEGHTRGMHVYLLRPDSRGTITLKSPDAFVQPIINPNYLQSSEDLEKLVRGVRLCLRIGQAEPYSTFIDHKIPRPDLDQELHHKTDDELRDIVRERVQTVYHPTTTCRMAPLEENGVVDSRLRVHGIKRLRVCDASIFPWIVSGHTAGACFAVGEKLADEIKKGH